MVAGRTLGVGQQRVPGQAPGTYHCVVREADRRSSLVLVATK